MQSARPEPHRRLFMHRVRLYTVQRTWRGPRRNLRAWSRDAAVVRAPCNADRPPRALGGRRVLHSRQSRGDGRVRGGPPRRRVGPTACTSSMLLGDRVTRLQRLHQRVQVIAVLIGAAQTVGGTQLPRCALATRLWSARELPSRDALTVGGPYACGRPHAYSLAGANASASAYSPVRSC